MPDSAKSTRIEDAPADGLLMRLAPESARPWLELMRADRPIGTWLLLLPCWQGTALALAVRMGSGEPGWSPYDYWLLAAFGIGAFVMRGAGCVLNDIVDRDFDRAVLRTRNRPIASGRIRPRPAAAFGLVLCLLGGLVLSTLNAYAIALCLLSLVPAAFYPFAKRLTWWPQLFLGIAFNWGALVGWAAITGSLSLAPLLLYAHGVCWTLGYDTIYALLDQDDDRRIGVKSTALLFKGRTRAAVGAFYTAAGLFAVCAAAVSGLGAIFWAGVAAVALHYFWQVHTLRVQERARCLRIFQSNRDAGLLLFAAILLGSLSL